MSDALIGSVIVAAGYLLTCILVYIVHYKRRGRSADKGYALFALIMLVLAAIIVYRFMHL